MRGNPNWFKGMQSPGRKPKGAVTKRTQIAQEVFKQLNFDPLEKKIRLALRLENKLRTNHFKDQYERIEYLKLYAEVLKDVLQYSYQKLKAVEHFGQIAIVQKLESLDTCTDEELTALLEEAQELVNAVHHV